MEKIPMKMTAMNILFLCSFPILIVTATPLDDGEPLSNQVVVKCPMEDGLNQKLAGLGPGAVDKWGVDEERKLHFRVSSENWAQLQAIQSGCSLLINNVEEYLDKMAMKQTKLTRRSVDEDESEGRVQVYGFDGYYELDDINGFYNDEIVTAYPNLAKIVPIGQTYKERDMYAVHITANAEPKEIGKIYLQCLIHAREWISGPVCMHIAKYLCVEYSKPADDDTKDATVTDLLDNLEFVIVPVVNPDGYHYTHQRGNRLWRKSLSTSAHSTCEGADLNRNFDYHWGEKSPFGTHPCDNEYHGDKALSEVEAKNVAGYFGLLGNVLGAVDFHCYSQVILRPYAYTNTGPSDNWRLKWMSIRMSRKIRAVHEKTYRTMRASDFVDALVSGVFTDWAYDSDMIKEGNGPRVASFTIELRGTKEDGYGFTVPDDKILATCQEITPAIINLAKELKRSPLPTP